MNHLFDTFYWLNIGLSRNSKGGKIILSLFMVLKTGIGLNSSLTRTRFLSLSSVRPVNNLLINSLRLLIIAGLPRARSAWDRAPYPWNMVNLFSFGYHVIDRAYVRTYVRVYGLYGWGRGDYQKEGRGVSGVSCQVHIFYIGHSQYGQLTAVKTG